MEYQRSFMWSLGLWPSVLRTFSPACKLKRVHLEPMNALACCTSNVHPYLYRGLSVVEHPPICTWWTPLLMKQHTSHPLLQSPSSFQFLSLHALSLSLQSLKTCRLESQDVQLGSGPHNSGASRSLCSWDPPHQLQVPNQSDQKAFVARNAGGV